MAIIYVAHPLAGDLIGNKRRTQRWLKWLMDNEPAHTFCCPWLPFLDLGADSDKAYRDRCLRDDIAIASVCDGIALCGPRISPGMQLELDAVLVSGGWAASFIAILDPVTVGRFNPTWQLRAGAQATPIAQARARWDFANAS